MRQRREPPTFLDSAMDLSESNTRPAAGSQRTCRRCGTCCRKGGPALHRIDRGLVMEGLIPAEALFTIREGEPVQDNVSGRSGFADGDILKIKGTGQDWRCRFLEDPHARCAIYDRRPVECRTLQCWDTRAIEALYDRERLTRRDLLEGVAGLWELVADHDRRCSFGTLRDHAARLSGPAVERTAAMDAITAMVRYDKRLRTLLVENGHAAEGLLDFLLGRPLTASLHGFQIRVTQDPGGIRLTHTRPI
jgi:Fe-S-cluster containining protein